MNRPTWAQTWMAMADAMALRSKCVGAQVGAVIVTRDNRLAAASYNGPAAGFRVQQYDGPQEPIGDCSHWCPRMKTGDKSPIYGLNCPSIHAEANALLRADFTDISGGTLYSTRGICADCAKLISNSGLTHVVHRVTESDLHRDPAAVENYLELCGLTIKRVTHE